MADITITAANVQPGSTVRTKQVTLGATVAAGQWVYLDTAAADVAKLAQADGTALEATVEGMALSDGVTGQLVLIAQSGSIVTVGSVLGKGDSYNLAATAGKMANEADLATTQYLTQCGYGISATSLQIAINNTGVTHV